MQLASAAVKYIKSLDRPTRERFTQKLSKIADDPFNPKNSYPLTSSDKRSSRVGGYRMQLRVYVADQVIVVSDVAQRGQIYDKKYQ